MRVDSFDTKLLLPRQAGGVSKQGVDHYLSLLRNPNPDNPIEPVPLVPLDDTPNSLLIIANGHHRSVAHYLSRLAVPGRVYETDEDIAGCTDEMTLAHYESLNDFRENYKNVLFPLVQRAGCVTMRAYVTAYRNRYTSFDFTQVV